MYLSCVVGYVWIKENGTQGFKTFQSQAPMVNNNKYIYACIHAYIHTCIHAGVWVICGPTFIFLLRYSCHWLGQISIVVNFCMYTCISIPKWNKNTSQAISDTSLSSWLLHFWYQHSEFVYQVGILYIWGANLKSSKCRFFI